MTITLRDRDQPADFQGWNNVTTRVSPRAYPPGPSWTCSGTRDRVTMNTYAHVLPVLRQEAADAIDELFGT